MTTVLRMTELYAPTLKETPADAAIPSHQLLLRAGFMRKSATGLYSYLPLGWRVIHKIEQIAREEMDGIGAQEIMMPVLQPAELWHESGRWDDYGPELMRLEDRHGVGMCLGPTHEEIIVDLVRNELKSYKQLPLTLYQIQAKFRDERRPRFGLMRSREFIMKDAYSYHTTQESLEETYQKMYDAYGRYCERAGLEYRPVAADSGQIGGKVTVEFHALAESGEAELVSCTCGWAANSEIAPATPAPVSYGASAFEKIATPGVHTIAELAAFLGCSEAATVKAMVGKNAEGTPVALFIPGDYDLNELKAERAFAGYELASDDEIEKWGLPKGSIGPVGLPEGILVGADESLRDIDGWVVGANEEGFHYVGAAPGRDFEVDVWADLCAVKEGNACPQCGAPLSVTRGIEVGQVFQLGTKYSEVLNGNYTDEEGDEHPYFMGCYGIGISRTMAAIVEQCNDEFGIFWPLSMAPAHVCVLPLTVGDDVVQPAAEKVAAELAELGLEVVIDDRDERPGVKFAEADLMGWPLQIVVGKRGLEAGEYELKVRRTNEKRSMSFDEFNEWYALSKREPNTVAVFFEQVGVTR